MTEYFVNAKNSEYSSTFVPYYDSIIDLKNRHELGEIKMTDDISDRVKDHSIKISQASVGKALRD